MGDLQRSIFCHCIAGKNNSTTSINMGCIRNQLLLIYLLCGSGPEFCKEPSNRWESSDYIGSWWSGPYCCPAGKGQRPLCGDNCWPQQPRLCQGKHTHNLLFACRLAIRAGGPIVTVGPCSHNRLNIVELYCAQVLMIYLCGNTSTQPWYSRVDHIPT